MFIFLSLLLASIISTHCMETPLGKRSGQELAPIGKVARVVGYGTPNLDAIPDDVTKIIIEYVLAGEGSDTNAQIDHWIKKSHPIFQVAKKYNTLSNAIFNRSLTRLANQYPQEIADLIDASAAFVHKAGSLSRFIKSPAASRIIFDCVSPRINSLMIAVGFKNEIGVKLLLDEAKTRGILKQYVNLNCGDHEGEKDGYLFDCLPRDTALHIAARQNLNDPSIPFPILERLLAAGANPNAQNSEQATPLFLALPSTGSDPQELLEAVKKVSALYLAGADPNIGPKNADGEDGVQVPEVWVEYALANDLMDPKLKQAYRMISDLFEAPELVRM